MGSDFSFFMSGFLATAILWDNGEGKHLFQYYIDSSNLYLACIPKYTEFYPQTNIGNILVSGLLL